MHVCVSVSFANDKKLDSIIKQATQILQKKVKFHGSRDFISLIKTIKRNDRKYVCQKIMNDLKKVDPVSSFTAANCLLYNGFGNSAIPFFTEFSSNGNNEKYLHGRMGYGWLHSGDWYEVGEDVLKNMTQGLDLFTWIQNKIRQETLNHPKKYGPIAMSNAMRQLLRLRVRKTTLTVEQKALQNKCKSPIINLAGYTCKFDKTTRRFVDCVAKDVSGLDLIGCGELKK